MKLPDWLKVYGDTTYRGKCAVESAEQITLFSQIRRHHPHLAPIVFHPRMEGERTKGQADWQKADGSIVKGVADVIGVGHPMLVMELKRRDHTQSVWQPGQLDFLRLSLDRGAFVCLCLGWESAMEALREWEFQNIDSSSRLGQ